MIQEFKDFIEQGDAMEMAIAFILGAAFTAIVNSIVDDLIMPIISLLTRGVDFANHFISLDGSNYATLAAAQEAGAAVFAYGSFLNALIQFLLIAMALFLIVRSLNKMRKEEVEEVTTKECPFCLSEVALEASRCPHCTSELVVK